MLILDADFLIRHGTHHCGSILTVSDNDHPEVAGLKIGDHVMAGGVVWAVTAYKNEVKLSDRPSRGNRWEFVVIPIHRPEKPPVPMGKLTDWELFVEIAKRLGAKTSTSTLDPDVSSSVRRGNLTITFDFNEARAYVTYPMGRKSWLDNNLLSWLDVILGRESI